MKSVSALTRLVLERLTKRITVFNEITLSKLALQSNVSLLESLSPSGIIIPVLKANAYGHGLREVSQILRYKTFPFVAVDGYFEALTIREVSKQPVLIMGAIDSINIPKLKIRYFSYVVHDKRTIETMGKTKKKFRIHLEIDTGMSRHGIDSEDIDAFIALFKKYSTLQLEGVMSHLADADNPDSTDYTENQVKLFDSYVKKILDAGLKPRFIHIAQSAGSAKVTSKYANATRVGLALYGISPFLPSDPYSKIYEDLQPVLELTSIITKVRSIPKGTTVSYGRTFTAKTATTIGVVPLGYYEGIHRELSNKGSVSIHGKSYRIAGRVNMNHTMIDLGTKNTITSGDKAVIISRNKKSAQSLASICETYGLFPYLMLSSLNPTIRRRIVE
jgi:alanine racemase